MKAIELAFVMVFGFLSCTAIAQSRDDECATDVFETVRQSMKISKLSPSVSDGNIVSAKCKRWPYKSNFLLSAFAYDNGVEGEKNLIIAVIDETTKRVISNYQSVIIEDSLTAVSDTSLNLDTARYQLATDIRAFGVRFNSSALGPNCGERYWCNELTLFVPEKNSLRPVLRLNLDQQQWLKGCPAATSEALWEDAVLTLSMAKTNTNGFYDIVVTAKITVTTEGVSAGSHKDRIERHTFHYDGITYQKGGSVPWWLEL